MFPEAHLLDSFARLLEIQPVDPDDNLTLIQVLETPSFTTFSPLFNLARSLLLTLGWDLTLAVAVMIRVL